MKTIQNRIFSGTRFACVLFALCCALITASQAQTGWTYHEYATISSANGTMFTLEYGVRSKGYDGLVKWKLTNHTQKPVYDVYIADRTYVLADKRVENRLGETMTTKLVMRGSRQPHRQIKSIPMKRTPQAKLRIPFFGLP